MFKIMLENKKLWLVGMLVVAVMAIVFPSVTLAAGGPPTNRGGSGGQGIGTGYLPAGEPLAAEQEAALVAALEEEYGALALYQSVMEDFGVQQPFSSIAQSEQTHVDALVNIFERYGLEVPAAPVATDLPEFDTVEAACATGVAAEIADGALYDELFPLFAAYPDITRVFTNLQRASIEQHLPAFSACEEGEVMTGIGYGGTQGKGRGNQTTGSQLGAWGQGTQAQQDCDGTCTYSGNARGSGNTR